MSSTSLSDNELAARMIQFVQTDNERQLFIQLLVSKVNELQAQLDDQVESKTKLADLETKVQKLQQASNKNPFVAVLVDGDGAKFADHLIQDTAKGGQNAVQCLLRALRDNLSGIELEDPEIPIIVRVYAKLGGLSRKLVEQNVIAREKVMWDFAETFTETHHNLDFINVGRDKDKADSKVLRSLKHYSNIIQCKKIYLIGCCRDKGYLNELRAIDVEETHKDRIVLVETIPAEPGFRQLNFPMIRFDQVFRSEAFPVEKEKGGSTKNGSPNATPVSPLTPLAVKTHSVASPRVDSPELSPTQAKLRNLA